MLTAPNKTMSLQIQRRGDTEYTYFYYYQSGRHKSMSLGRKDRPNVPNIYKAIAIIEVEEIRYRTIREQLSNLLSGGEMRRLQARVESPIPSKKIDPAILQIPQLVHRGLNMKAFSKEQMEAMLKELTDKLSSEDS